MRPAWTAFAFAFVFVTACSGRPLPNPGTSAVTTGAGAGSPVVDESVVAGSCPASPGAVFAADLSPEFLDCGKTTWQTSADEVVPRLLPTRVLAARTRARRLVADDSGVYWLTDDTQLWVLPESESTPRLLATDLSVPPTVGFTSLAAGVALTPDFVFWLTSHGAGEQRSMTLHRTMKDGGGDSVLLDHLPTDGLMATDGNHLFLSIDGSDSDHQLALATLPVEASPGAPLSISGLGIVQASFTALAVDDSRVYWANMYNGNTMSCISVGSADKCEVLRASPPPAVAQVPGESFALAPVGDTLFFGHASAVASVPKRGGTPTIVAHLAGDPEVLIPMGDWLLTSFKPEGSEIGQAVAIRINGWRPSPPLHIQVADGLASPVAVAGDRLVFLDADTNLRELAAADLALVLPGSAP